MQTMLRQQSAKASHIRLLGGLLQWRKSPLLTNLRVAKYDKNKIAGPVGIPDVENRIINIFRSHDLRLSSPPATSSLYKGVSGDSEDRRDILTTLRAQQTC
jgi:hypothetical protein